jgi:hypothetical protein
MTPEDINEILSSDDMLEPPSGFVSNVMDRVLRHDEEPPPQRFPWLRFAFGIISCLVLAASATVLPPRLEQSLLELRAPLGYLSGITPELAYAAASVIFSFGFISYRRLRLAT